MMRQHSSRRRLGRMSAGAILMAAALALSGCGDSGGEEDAILMPAVEGLTLDIARSDIERAGYTEDFEVISDGTFGAVNEANWEVCTQTPAAGDPIDVEPRLIVARSCDEATEDAEDTEGPDETEDAEVEEPDPTETEDPEAEAEALKRSIEEEEAAYAGEAPPARVSAADVEAKYLDHLQMPFSDMCDEYYTHWACFYQGVEGDPSNFLRVNLLTDGGWHPMELEAMAETAGRHWFNFIGCDFPQIDAIEVNVNGEISVNVYRSELPNSCG